MVSSEIMLSAVWTVIVLMLQSVAMVRSECTNGALLRAQCSSLSIRSFLLHESQIGSVRIRCNFQASSYTWSISEDGIEANAVVLDTSLDKYTVVDTNSLDVTLNNVTGEDGGLYRCVYGSTGTTPELCVYVYERAVFASCPQEYSGCSKEVPLSVTLGNPAIFNASVTYTPGGSCDFKQTITRIKLTKINEKSNLPNTLLYTCSTNQGAACIKNDDRLSLNRGDGLDFIFTLSSAHQNDSGLYEVVVEGTHPATGSLIAIKKSFHLNVLASPPSAPFGVQALCSVVVWYSPEVSCEETINGYEVWLYDPNFIQTNVTRYVGANRTFYALTEEDKLLSDNLYVQVRVLFSSEIGQWSNTVSVGCDNQHTSIPKTLEFNVYFSLNGTVFLNNSATPLLDVGEGDYALQCRTSRDECCKTLPNRFGHFYYPNGTEISNTRSGYGFYRNRGQKVIYLNRMTGVTSPKGKYKCEIPDADGVTKSIFITLTEY